MATTICCVERKWPYFWLTHWPNEYILVNTQDGEPRAVDSITLVRLPSTQWYCSAISGIFGRPENTVTLRGEFEKQLRADRVKGFNGTQASMRFNGFNEVQSVQRGSKASRRSKRFKGCWRGPRDLSEESRVLRLGPI